MTAPDFFAPFAASMLQTARSPQDKLLAYAISGNEFGVYSCIAAGANVNGKGPLGTPVLMYAAARKSYSCVDVLLAAGADVNAKGIIGGTPLMWAACAGDDKSVRALLAAGADVGAKDQYGRDALHMAKEYDRDECAKLLKAAVDRSREPGRPTPQSGHAPGCRPT